VIRADRDCEGSQVGKRVYHVACNWTRNAPMPIAARQMIKVALRLW
jgi:hypothetical protein